MLKNENLQKAGTKKNLAVVAVACLSLATAALTVGCGQSNVVSTKNADEATSNVPAKEARNIPDAADKTMAEAAKATKKTTASDTRQTAAPEQAPDEETAIIEARDVESNAAGPDGEGHGGQAAIPEVIADSPDVSEPDDEPVVTSSSPAKSKPGKPAKTPAPANASANAGDDGDEAAVTSSVPAGTVLVKCSCESPLRSDEPVTIESASELANLVDYRGYVRVLDASGRSSGEDKSLEELFDKSFFESNFLVAAFQDCGSGSLHVHVEGFSANPDGTYDVDVVVDPLGPGQLGTCDMAYWIALVPQAR